ncbi:hypothetical protein WJX72_001037 [[Myrmecia] bisecta]|uniref:DNA mismatch repair protein MSH5 n=1 Tax=[Myrmecia] bisecta TaxID=41462 RepID=A0AAW1P9F4_9CHLO
MGQGPSVLAAEDGNGIGASNGCPPPSQVEAPVCLRSRYQTTVIDFGDPNTQGVFWHVVNGQRIFPYPAGYRASTLLYGQQCSLEINTVQEGARTFLNFVVRWDAGRMFSGNTPSAPFINLALFVGSFQAADGPQAFGFDSPVVQCKLRSLMSAALPASPLKRLEDLQTAKPILKDGILEKSSSLQDPNNAARALLLSAQTPSSELTRLANVCLSPTKTKASRRQVPSVKRMLTFDAKAQAVQGAAGLTAVSGLGAFPGRHPATAEFSLPSSAASGPSRHSSRLQQPQATSSALGGEGQTMSDITGPPRPRSTHLDDAKAAEEGPPELRGPGYYSTLLADSLAEPATQTGGGVKAEPGGRARPKRRAGSSGKSARGWTAFTCYGLEMRAQVRSAHPHASATEVEKLVGQAWARLPPKDKASYQAKAAGMKRQVAGPATPPAPAVTLNERVHKHAREAPQTSSAEACGALEELPANVAMEGTSTVHQAQPRVHGRFAPRAGLAPEGRKGSTLSFQGAESGNSGSAQRSAAQQQAGQHAGTRDGGNGYSGAEEGVRHSARRRATPRWAADFEAGDHEAEEEAVSTTQGLQIADYQPLHASSEPLRHRAHPSTLDAPQHAVSASQKRARMAGALYGEAAAHLSSLLLLRDMLAGTAAAARCPSRGQHPQHAQHAYRAPNGLDYFGSAYNESAFDEAARHRSSAVPLAASDPLLPGSRFAASDQIGYPGGSTSYTLGRPESPAPSFLQQPSLSPSGLSSGQPFTYSQQRQSRQPHHHQPQQRSYHLNQQQHAYYDQPNEPHQADEDMPSTPSIITKALTCISEELLTCRSLVAEIIDFDQAADGMMVAYGVCDPLDELKHTYHGLPDFLTRVVEDELNRIPRELGHRLSSQLWSIIYIPQVGFVMRLEGQRLTAELEEFLPDFEFAFEGTAEESCGFYYYTDRTRQLNERFGDLLHKIQDLEGSITTELIRRIAAFGPHMNRAVAVAAELDCLISLATCAREFNYTKPKLTHDNILHIKQGRHMLTEMMVEGCYVPNDTDMAEDSNRVQVITGPNFSGKSCYAKQVGLIVFLAHIGSFVPAAEATIGLTDRIFTRIASQETLSVPQSTFMIDLSQMSTMLRHATGRSLCIIDEFGKGTLTTDGVGLLCATLRHFSGALQPPKVLACTHFSEVLEEENLPRCRQLTFLTMNVLADPLKSGAEQDKVVFLYRIVPGYAAPSFGVHCAQLAGLKPDILQRAVQVIEDQQAVRPQGQQRR